MTASYLPYVAHSEITLKSPVYPPASTDARMYSGRMGRNFPSATELVHQTMGHLGHVGEMLSPQDRLILNEFVDLALNKRAAIANAAGLQPLEVLLLLALLEEHKNLQRMKYELRIEIERLQEDML